jgi:flagellar M-ring protein FliF
VTRRTENVAYQSSRTVRHVKLPQGNIKHMSVSVLVDHSVRWEGSGAKAKRLVEPPTPEKLKAIRDLVAGVIGLSTERGDQLVVEALPFEATLAPEQIGPGPAANPPPADQIPAWLRTLLANRTYQIAAAAGAVVLLVVLVVLMKMVMGRGKKRAVIQAQLEAASPAKNMLASAEKATQHMEAQIAEQTAIKKQQEIEAMTALKLPQVKTKKSEVLTKHIAEEAKKDATTMVQVLRNWINEVDTTR